jgi:two-component sensor histidine kinase
MSRSFCTAFKNEYTKMISFASLMATRSPNPEAKAALCQLIDHLHASAEAHRVLRPPLAGRLVNFTAGLTQLRRATVSAVLDRRGTTLHLTVSGSILLDDVRCWHTNLVLSELITNASRHACGRPHFGRCHHCLWVDLCQVSDDGSSAPTPEPGLGTQLIEKKDRRTGERIFAMPTM